MTEGSREPRASLVSRVTVPRRELLVAVLAVAIGATALVGSALGVLPGCTDPAWGCQLAHDPPGFAGSNTAIAFDSAGSAWVSFRDQDAQALMVARYVGEAGDCAGNEAWECTVVDDPAGHDVGFETDIAFTADGKAWVSYQDTTTDDLKVAHTVAPGPGSGCSSSATDWSCEAVDSSSQVGGYTAIAVENGTPLVTYWDAGRNDLRWARPGTGAAACDAGSWSCGIVDSGAVGAYANDLAVDSSGRAWAAYRYSGSGTGPQAAKLVVATHVGSGGSGCGSGSPEWSCMAIAKTGNVGLDTGIAFDVGGKPWVHYWNNNNLNLARLDPGGTTQRCSVAADWECTTIHDTADSVGEYGGIAFDAKGSAWIAYHGATAKRAYVAHHVGGGAGSGCGSGGSTAWACSTLDASGDVGAFWMGIAVRPTGAWGTGEPWVSYYDRTRGALKVAVLQGAPTGGSAPVVTGLSPTSGPVGTGVTISGSNLTGATAVMFAGIFAAFPVPSDTQITATVPGGAKTGPITVVTPAGSATSSQSFRVTKR